jgi:uncharacterized protein YmfQ (DUF2313 family)
MAGTLTDTAEQLLERVPGYWRGEPYYEAMINAVAKELDRLTAAIEGVRREAFPTNATDTYGMLAVWEATMGLPVRPPGTTINQRRANVLSKLQARQSASGASWVEVVSALLGNGWTYEEGTTEAFQIEQVLRDSTPANLEIAVVYAAGFQVGIGLVGIDRL